jgi:HAD superfamily hydrolase (TIGR01490 family)
MAIAFFDMDKTLLSVSSGEAFVKWLALQMRISLRELGQTARVSLEYKRGTLDFPAAMALLATHTRGGSARAMTALCNTFFNHKLAGKIAPDAVEQVREHQDAGDPVYILSASTQFVVRPVARFLGLPYRCTELEVVDDTITGKIAGENCFGPGKKFHAGALCAAHNLTLADAVFYSDSISDMPLLEAVGTPVAVNPDKKLKAEAKARGWPIRSFY